MIRTYLLEYKRLPDPLENESCMNGLLKERIEKIIRIKHPDARKQSFGAGLLLKKVLRQADAGAEIYYNSFGKPLLEGVSFSISHTENYVILSMADGKEAEAEAAVPELFTGCDIEKYRPYNPKIARRFFTLEEYQSLEKVTDEQGQAELFCRYWTRKESVMKLTGLGMALPMDLFDVRADQAAVDAEKLKAWSASVKEKTQPEYAQAAEILLDRELFFKEYWHGGCCITVCSTWKQFATELSVFSV